MVKCFVPGCGSTRTKDPDLTFCRIPNSESLKAQWQASIYKGTGSRCEKAFRNENSRICCRHFQNKDLSHNSHYKQRKCESIPTIFAYTHSGFSRETSLKCRICLKNAGLEELNLENTLPNSSITISNAILKSFDINLKDDPDFPKTICARCYNLVAASYVLKLEILKSRASLLILLELRKEKKFYKIFDGNDGNEFEIAKMRQPCKSKYILKVVPPAPRMPTIVSSTSISSASHRNSSNSKILNFEFVSESNIKTEIKDEPLEMPIVGEQKIFAEVLSGDELIKEFKQEEEEIIHDAPIVEEEKVDDVEVLFDDELIKELKQEEEEIIHDASIVEEEKVDDCFEVPSGDWLVLEEVDLDEELGTNYNERVEGELLEVEEKSQDDNYGQDSDKMIEVIQYNTLSNRKKPRNGNVKKSYKVSKPGLNPPGEKINFEQFLKNIPQEKPVSKVYEEWPIMVKPVIDRFPHRRCKNCDFVGNHLFELLAHVDENENCLMLYNPTKECYICHRKFMKHVNKVKHIKRDHTDFKTTVCTFCFRAGLNSPISYERHVRRHHVPPDVVCTFCGKGFYKNEHLTLHVKRFHDDSYWLRCDHCDFKCKYRDTILNHMRHHFKIRKTLSKSGKILYMKNKACNICGKLVNACALKKHIFLIHKQTTKPCNYCRTCDYVFLFEKEFLYHVDKCNGIDGKKIPADATRIRRADLDPKCHIKNMTVR